MINLDGIFNKLTFEKQVFLLATSFDQPSNKLNISLTNCFDQFYSASLKEDQLPALKESGLMRQALERSTIEVDQEGNLVLKCRIRLQEGVVISNPIKLRQQKVTKKMICDFSFKLGEIIQQRSKRKSQPEQTRPQTLLQKPSEKKIDKLQAKTKRRVELLNPNMRRRKARGAQIMAQVIQQD